MIESEVLTWNSKVANAILAQVQGTCLDESRESSQLIQQQTTGVCKKETQKKSYPSTTRSLYPGSCLGTVGGILLPELF